jgi:hypothetical protein
MAGVVEGLHTTPVLLVVLVALAAAVMEQFIPPVR